MTVDEEQKKFCLSFAEFPGADMPWLIDKSAVITAEMSERLSGAFLWHAAVPCPEDDGFRVYFELAESETSTDTVAETLVAIIREVASDDLPRV